jgi:hypothetical protein
MQHSVANETQCVISEVNRPGFFDVSQSAKAPHQWPWSGLLYEMTRDTSGNDPHSAPSRRHCVPTSFCVRSRRHACFKSRMPIINENLRGIACTLLFLSSSRSFGVALYAFCRRLPQLPTAPLPRDCAHWLLTPNASYYIVAMIVAQG